MGFSGNISFIDENPTPEQAALFERLICSLQDTPSEFLVFEFQNAENGPEKHQGLVFFQLCREDGKIRAEFRTDGLDGRRMYMKRMTEEETVRVFRRMVRTRTAPDSAGWEDITAQAFTKPGDEEFE